jgi:hypothetical protein
VKVLTAKLQTTLEQVTSAETEGNNYRAYWQDAESKLLKTKSSHLLEIRNCETQLSSAQDQVVELQAALTSSNAVASKAKVEWVESQRRLSQFQSEADSAQGMIENLKSDVENLRKALQAARENVTAQRNLTDVAKPIVQTAIQATTIDSVDRKFESTVTSSIVELSIVVGKQQANMTRLEEQLQLMNSKADTKMQGQKSSHKQHAWNAVATGTFDSSDFASRDNTTKVSGRVGAANDSDTTTRRNVKFEEHVKDSFRERPQVFHPRHKHSEVDETSSSEDLTLISLLNSPPDAKDARNRVAEHIADIGRRIESLVRNDPDSDTIQKTLKLENAILSEAEGFWAAAKSVLRKRSTKITELKAQWKAHNLRGTGGGLGMSSSLINQQVNALHDAIKISDELGRCIEARKQSLRALREIADKTEAHQSGSSIDNKLHVLRKELRSELRLLINIMARSNDNAAACERDAQRDRERGRGGGRRLKEQSFDDSYIQYDRHQVVDRFYADRAGRAAETPEFTGRSQQRTSSSRYPSAVASSLEFPLQTAKSMDQRRLIAQQHIAKIEKQQTDTWKECEDHVKFALCLLLASNPFNCLLYSFLTKMRKDLGAVSYSTSGAAKTGVFPPSSLQSDRENTTNYNCNMLLSGLESDKKLYDL